MWPFKRKAGVEHEVDDEPDFEGFLQDSAAFELKKALHAKDWQTARSIYHNAATPEHFSYYLYKAADTGGVMEWIDGPIRDEPHSTLPLLVKGARAVFWAWAARGEGLANTVSQEAWKIWFHRLKVAEDCFDDIIEREPANADAWHWLIVLGRARQVSKEELWRRFNGLLASNPLHYYGNTAMLEGLKAKWSGSTQQMFDFARERAAAAPGTAMPSLVLDAHIENRYDNGGWDYFTKPEVIQDVLEAAEQSIWHPSFQRSLLTPLLWNDFAKVFAVADRRAEAERCFQEIGDEFILEGIWGTMEVFLGSRRYVRHKLSGG